MMSPFFTSIRFYIILGLIVVLVGFGIKLSWVNSELAVVKNNLVASEAREKTLSESNRTLMSDLEAKEHINYSLAIRLDMAESIYKEDLVSLTDHIAELMKQDRKESVITVNKNVYIKETYVEKATDTVLVKMWDSYCKQEGGCQ